MIELENLKPGVSLTGIEPTLVVTLVAVVAIGDGAVQAIYKTPEGTLKDRLLTRADEANISVATEERPWAFDGNGEDFKLAVEAKRIDLAFLFDPMMAVHTSNVDPLPHQITAVYDAMLPRQPLRFVLADGLPPLSWTPRLARVCAWRDPWQDGSEGSSRTHSRRTR